MEKAALFWSGGKDSAFALYQCQLQDQFKVECLVTTLNETHRRISMHGIREALLDRQAALTGLPLIKMWVPESPDNSGYERSLMHTFHQLRESGITTVLFGDIFLEDLRAYRENLVNAAGLQAGFPLWGRDTGTMVREFLDSGFRTIACAISTAYLEKDLLGQEISEQFLNRLPPGADPCGENGEYHTFCFGGPVFREPVKFRTGEERFVPLEIKTSGGGHNEGFWFVDLIGI
ncbi:MAG TPA: ATP-binding protein [Sphingobacteriaceae bacterium]